jgi:hypothetical protein
MTYEHLDFLDKAGNLAIDKLAEVLGLAPDPDAPKLKALTKEQLDALGAVQDQAISNYKGNIDQLESALGMLLIGHHFGWRALHIFHNKKTVRIYEAILGIRIREFFDEEGPSSNRSVGLAIAKKASNFWKVVSGDTKIPHRREIIT